MIKETLPTLILAAATLSACSTLAPTPPPPAVLRSAWNNGLASTPSAAQLAPTRWWQQFRSPHLDLLIDTALRNNPGVAAARERVLAARALQGTGSPSYKPALALATGSEPTPGAAASYFQAGFDANWELPLFERGANTSRILTAQTADAEATLADARSELVAETVRAYLDGSTATDQIQWAEKLTTLEDQRLERISARVALGLDAKESLQSSQQMRRDSQLGLQSARLARARSLERLTALLGRDAIDNAWMTAFDGEFELPSPLVGAPAAILRERPDVRHAEAAIVRSAAELGIARAELYPHINLAGALTAAVRLSSGSANSANSIFSAGPVINLPLFDWGLRRAQSEARGAVLRAATLAYRQVVLDAVAESEIAFLQLTATTQRVTALSAAAKDARNSALQATVRRRLGLLAQVATLDLERESILAQQDLENARHQQAMAFVHVYKVLGRGAFVADNQGTW